MRRIVLVFAAVTGLSGCAGAVKLENVAGTWTCPRVDGVCADISTIDAGAIGAGAEAPPWTDGSLMTSSGGERAPLPARSGDEVARIVIAPSVDADGHYHGPREVFAVMKPGSWIAAPAMPAPPAQPAAPKAPDPEGGAHGE